MVRLVNQIPQIHPGIVIFPRNLTNWVFYKLLTSRFLLLSGFLLDNRLRLYMHHVYDPDEDAKRKEENPHTEQSCPFTTE
jgi:hypothetical protein